MKAWLKGGAIGLIIGLVYGLISILITYLTGSTNIIFGLPFLVVYYLFYGLTALAHNYKLIFLENFFASIVNSVDNTYFGPIIVSILLGFIIGTIIGLITQKVRK